MTGLEILALITLAVGAGLALTLLRYLIRAIVRHDMTQIFLQWERDQYPPQE